MVVEKEQPPHPQATAGILLLVELTSAAWGRLQLNLTRTWCPIDQISLATLDNVIPGVWIHLEEFPLESLPRKVINIVLTDGALGRGKK